MPLPDARTRGLSGRDRGRLTAAVVTLALVLGVWLIHDGAPGHGPPPVGAAVVRASDTPAGTGQSSGGQASPSPESKPGNPPPQPLPPSAPTRVRIPAIKVNAPLAGLDLDPAGHLDTPPVGRPNQAGWYRNGPAPGAPGNAVLAGHADTRSGPAVFYRLGLLRLGDQIEVVREDRRTAVFTIDAVRTYPRAAFPDAEVYGPTERPELRVITCGGTYDKKSGYSNNVVVFAHLTSSR
ncbi:class F sortase [Kitasatospora gansuensis]